MSVRRLLRRRAEDAHRADVGFSAWVGDEVHQLPKWQATPLVASRCLWLFVSR